MAAACILVPVLEACGEESLDIGVSIHDSVLDFTSDGPAAVVVTRGGVGAPTTIATVPIKASPAAASGSVGVDICIGLGQVVVVLVGV